VGTTENTEGLPFPPRVEEMRFKMDANGPVPEAEGELECPGRSRDLSRSAIAWMRERVDSEEDDSQLPKIRLSTV
jgi:hypothetical protein